MRVKRGTVSRRRHKAFKKLAKGFRGRRKNCFKFTKVAVEKSLQYSYRDRRTKKRDFRKLWITRINAAARLNGLTYGNFIHGLSKSGVELDRKALADLAMNDAAAFSAVVEVAKQSL